MNFGDINPSTNLSLVDWIKALRKIYEENGPSDKTNRGIAMLMLKRSEDKYQLNEIAYAPEVPDLGAVMSLLGGLYMAKPGNNAALVVTDSWGLPLHLRDQQMRESTDSHQRLLEGKTTPEDEERLVAAFREKWGKPVEYPEEERTEVSTYVLAADNGAFIAAEQLRGMNNELYWYGSAESPEPDHIPLTDTLSNFLRMTVERKKEQ